MYRGIHFPNARSEKNNVNKKCPESKIVHKMPIGSKFDQKNLTDSVLSVSVVLNSFCRQSLDITAA